MNALYDYQYIKNIPDNVKWLHIDLCKNYLKDEEKYYPVGCTGMGYRLGLKLVMNL